MKVYADEEMARRFVELLDGMVAEKNIAPPSGPRSRRPVTSWVVFQCLLVRKFGER